MATIYAPATPPGRSGVAILRISGPRAIEAAGALVTGDLPPPRRAGLRSLAWNGQPIDEAIVLVFPGPGSFTGEDMVELQVHGSVAVMRRLQDVFAEMGLDPAGPGDFTRRALVNGRMSLDEVEALGDLLDAETDLQRAQSLRLLRGAGRDRTTRWRESLLRALALLETAIDFAEEEVPADVERGAIGILDDLAADLHVAVEEARRGAELRRGFEVAVIGRPNSGKSSLINYLAGREAAIVSDRPGTTRDVIELRYDLDGLPVTFLDTAGIRGASDEVEGRGIALAQHRANAASLRVFLSDPSEIEGIERRSDDLVARAFADRGDGTFSSVTGEGIATILHGIALALSERVSFDTGFARDRHRRLIGEALRSVQAASRYVQTDVSLAAEEVRMANHGLAELVGEVGTEEVLGEVFSSFCIGK